MTDLNIETEGSGYDGNFSSLLSVQYLFCPPVMAKTLIVLWLKKGGNDSSNRCGRRMPLMVSMGGVVLGKGKGSIDAPTKGNRKGGRWECVR